MLLVLYIFHEVSLCKQHNMDIVWNFNLVEIYQKTIEKNRGIQHLMHIQKFITHIS